jgi:hypothetical protein
LLFACNSFPTISRQVCFRKVKNSTFDDIDDSGDDENIVSVDNLLAQAAEDPDSDGNISDEEQVGSPLSTGSALAPANTTYRNTLLCLFYDAAQASQQRLSAREGEQAVSSSQPSVPPTQMSAGPSQTTMTTTPLAQSQTLTNEDLNRDKLPTHPTPLARIDLYGKHPHSQLVVHGKENLEGPVHVSNKKPRGGGLTMAGRGGRRKK